MADISEKTLEVLQRMSEVLAEMKTKEADLHTKAPTVPATAQRLHGWNGVFSSPGIDREVVTAHMRPEGIAANIPMLPTNDENPLFYTLTGIQEYTGSEPTNVCNDAPSGFIKGVGLTARFGRVRRDTNTIDMTQTVRRINRGEYTDLVLRGRLLGLANLAPADIDEANVLDIVTKSEMVTTAVLTERKLLKMIWQGSFSVANEFPGLDVQIATGQKDAETGTLSPAMDSYVNSYGKVIANDIVDYISTMEWFLQNNARKMGLDPVTWIIVCRPDLFQELTAVWPIAYNTTRGNILPSNFNGQITLDGRTNITERDAMRNGRYLDVNGTRYDVVLDDGIFEKNNTNTAGIPAGTYASSIYFVPLTIAGNMPVTYRQYLDYRAAQPEVALLNNMQQFFWTDNGMFSWAYEQTKWCYKLALLTEQRMVLRTPQLAGRIDNVRYTPLTHLRDTDPASTYFADGGVSLRNTGNFTPFAVWGR